MEQAVQLDLERCVLVLGPQVAAECLQSSPARPTPPALSYNMLLEAGVQKMLDTDHAVSNEEKVRKRALLVNAYELDPSFVGNVVVNSLKKNNCYKQWLDESFSTLSQHNTSHTSTVASGFVEKLRSLQKSGVLLIYTYYDVVLDNVLGTSPVLMDSEEDVHNWANRSVRGILHVHGVHSKPDSVCCDCVNYDQIMGGSKSGRFLKDLCKTKTVLFAGFDNEFYDPFMPKFSSTFVDTVSRQPPLLISCMNKIPHTASFLTLKISQMTNLETLLVQSSSTSRQGAAGLRESMDISKQPLSTTLHYSDKKSCQEAAEHVKTISSINVHQLTMRHEVSHDLELFQDREGLKSLWKVLFLQSEPKKLTLGLLGVTLGAGCTVWISIPPHVRERSSGHVTSDPAPPSLSTSVSVIPSMFTPIVSPSVSQPPMKHALTPSTRPTLPSPLIASTSRSLINMGRTSHLLPPDLQTLPLLNPKRFHSSSQLRKAKSYYDRTDVRSNPAVSPSKKNGLLTHRESAPDFMYTPEGVVAYQSNPHLNPKPNSVSQPSPLLRDGSNIELKIEYIDQYNGPSKKAKKDNTTTSESEHKNKLLEYIHDAKQWSKNVEAKLPKKPALSLPTTQETTGSLLLNSNLSPEEQEKFLQQHFETIQRSSKQTTSPVNHLSGRSPISPNRTSVPVSLQLPGLNPFLQLSTSGGVYPFLSPSSTISSSTDYQLPTVTTGLSQLAAASPLNPYQAMMQFMTQHSKKPAVVTDPSVIQGLHGNLPETFPCLLPNGSIAMLSTKLALQKEAEDRSPREEPVKSPQSSTKRGRTPETEHEVFKPMLKRRRSTSLPPELYNFNQMDKSHKETIKEETEDSKPGDTQRTLSSFPEGLRPRELHVPPLSMMHLQQDLKMIPEQMLGFPTPQSSPCPPIGGFNLSQFIVSGSSFAHHQPMTPVTPNDTSSNNHEEVECSDARTPPPHAPEGALPPFPQGRGPIQLWQFLLDLLISPDKQHMIQWTGNGYEFRIILPEEIAKLWGARKNKPRMNYDKLSRGLRYYYSKGIMDKVPGKKLTFKYTCDVQQFIQKRCSQGNTHSSTFSNTPLTPMSATLDNNTESKQQHHQQQLSNDGGSSSVFHHAMTRGKSPLFPSGPMLSATSSSVSKSPTPDSPDTVSADEAPSTNFTSKLTAAM